MSSKPMPWIKQYPMRLHDVRLAALSERQQLRFYQLYLLAGLLNADGAFIQDGKELSILEIGFLLRVTDCKQLEKDLAALRKSKLIRVNGHGPFIADFKDEQLNWVEKQRDERERKAAQRNREKVTRDTSVTGTMSLGGHAPRTRIQNQNQNPEPEPDQPPFPPSVSSDLAGGLGSKKISNILDGPKFKALTKTQRAVMTRIQKVLSLSGLGPSKIENQLHIVTTRNSIKNKMQYVLAALASAYADKSANNKPIIAAHRMEKDNVPAEFFSPARWDVIPQAILDAAGDVGITAKTKDERIKSKVQSLRERSKA